MSRGGRAGFSDMKVIFPARRLHEVFYAMGMLAHLPGGPHHVYFPPTDPLAKSHFDEIEDFSSRLDWVRSVQASYPPLLQYALDLRPYARTQDGRSMLAKISYYCGVYEFKPWFERMQASSPHIVLARTTSQHNSLFPWKSLISAVADLPLRFIGTEAEFAAFQPCIPDGVSIAHHLPDWGGTALDLCLSASLIITNHSPVQAIAEGAHIPCISEVSISDPDNIYLRPGSSPCFSTRAVVPAEVPVVGGRVVQDEVGGILTTAYLELPTPPGGWKVSAPDRKPRSFEHLDEACFYLCRRSPDLKMGERDYARRMIIRENLDRDPEWGQKAIASRLYKKPLLALQCASRNLHLQEYLPPVESYHQDLCD